jgi:hypothetical protein
MPATTKPKPAGRMTADEILAELGEIAGPLDDHEAEAKRLIARRLELWVAARQLPKADRPIFMTLAEASNRSEALVVRHTGAEFKRRGIDPKTLE